MKFIFLLISLFFTTSYGLPVDYPENHKLPYILVEPLQIEDSELYPLVVCLHGAGGRGNDNSGKGCQAYNVLKRKKYRKKYPSYLLVPQCPKGQQWVDTLWRLGNYSIDNIEISDELDFVLQLIDSVSKNHPIDKNRIYITGQSMGGFGTWDLILRKPDLFACAIPVCGGGDTSKVNRIKTLPVWMFHGSEDQVIPVNASREMFRNLKKLNNKVRYTEFEGVKHGSWIPAWQNEKLIKWMFQQKASVND
jgi:predicted peptidase